MPWTGRIGFDDAGALHITYYNDCRQTLYHAWKTGSDWQKEIIFEGQRVVDSRMIATGDGWEMESNIPGRYFNYSDPTAMIRDASGRIHMLGGSDLVYMHQAFPGSGVRLEMPGDSFQHYQSISLNAYLRSDGSPLQQAPLCIVLEYQQNYWFWPEWNGQFAVARVDVHEKGSAYLPIVPFYWRESLPAPLHGLVLWGALLDESMTGIIGGMEGIGRWEFSVQ